MPREMVDNAEFLASYPTAPLAVACNDGNWPEPRYRRSLVACARWEARYIAEWVSYHLSIGFDHIYLYCNDDDPGEFFRQILPFTTGATPSVTFHHYGIQGLQFQMYFHFVRNHAPETEWFMLLDIDEFVCLRRDRDMATFVEKLSPDTDAIYFNWCCFGNNGHVTRPAGDVLLNYTRREATITPFTKVLMRSSRVPYRAFFNDPQAHVMHDWVKLDRSLRARNVLGESANDYYDDFPRHAWSLIESDHRSERMLATAFVAHFNIKSDEDFDLRARRGLKGDYAMEKMWSEKNDRERTEHNIRTNAIEDTWLHDYWADYLAGGAWKGSVFAPTLWPELSGPFEAMQSSTAHQRSVADDAAQVLNGSLIARPQSHTRAETDPWWAVDLVEPRRIHEIRLFNRLDGVLERMANLRIEISDDGETWSIQHEKLDGQIFGGADGTPYRYVDEDGFVTRHLRIVVPGHEQFFHLDQVKFYGEAVGTATLAT